MADLEKIEPQEMEEPIVYTCPYRKYVTNSLCRPAHRCDLEEGHTGKHQCNCGLKFYGGESV